MKKAIIAVFSVSITAGTIYLTYSKLKERKIDKLLGRLQQEAAKRSIVWESQTLLELKQELEIFFLWDVNRFVAYCYSVLNQAPKTEQMALFEKIKNLNLNKRAKLKRIDELLLVIQNEPRA